MGININKVVGGVADEKTENYTLTEYDFGSIVVFNSAVDVVCTIPNGLRIGYTCTVIQKGVGKVSFVTDQNSDTKVNGLFTTQKTPASWAWARVICTAINEYTVSFSGAAGNTNGNYPTANTRLTNPHIIGNILYFDLLNVDTGAIIYNYESVVLQGVLSGTIKYINQHEYTLLAEDNGSVLVFGPLGRQVVEPLGFNVIVPTGLPDNFFCNLVPKQIAQNEYLSVLSGDGSVILFNTNNAFHTAKESEQILVQGIGFVGDFGNVGYNISFVEKTNLGYTPPANQSTMIVDKVTTTADPIIYEVAAGVRLAEIIFNNAASTPIFVENEASSIYDDEIPAGGSSLTINITAFDADTYTITGLAAGTDVYFLTNKIF